MLPWTLSFLCGDLLLQFFSKLPNSTELIIIMTVSLFGTFLFKNQKWLFACGLGFVWSAWFATSWTLPHEWEDRILFATGYVASLPQENAHQTHFLFSLEQLNNENLKNKIIRLSWRDHPRTLKVGDSFHLAVKLKRIHGVENPGSFDFEAWALQSHIRATGYVVKSPENIFYFTSSLSLSHRCISSKNK